MKILYLNGVPENSQQANLIQVKAMCAAMVKLSFQVILSLPGKASRNHPLPSYEVLYRKSIFPNDRIDKYLNFLSIHQTIRNVNPDIIYLRDPILMVHSFLFSRKQIIFESHNNKLHEEIRNIDLILRWFLKRAVARGRIIKVVCISQALSNYWIKEGIPAKQIISAHDGINPESFMEDLTKTEFREKLNLPVTKKIATYSGRLYQDRKIDNIIKLASIFPEIHFLVIGGPDENSKLYRSLSAKKGVLNIQFTGQIDHSLVPQYLQASDILLALWSSKVRTINYCSPLKLFEYMAAKRIIVAHSFPPIREVLKHYHNALLVEPESFDDLVEKLDKAVKLDLHLRVNIEENAHTDVMNKYTWEKRVRLIFDTAK